MQSHLWPLLPFQASPPSQASPLLDVPLFAPGAQAHGPCPSFDYAFILDGAGHGSASGDRPEGRRNGKVMKS